MKTRIFHFSLFIAIPIVAVTIFMSAGLPLKNQKELKNFQSGLASTIKPNLPFIGKGNGSLPKRFKGSSKSKDSINGLHIFTCSHSFHAFMPKILDDIAQSAGIKNHLQLGNTMIGGSRVIQHWKVPEEKNLAKGFLSKGQIDVLTLSPIWLPDSGIEKFGEFAVRFNPHIRIMVQEFWIPNDIYNPIYPYKTREKVDHNNATISVLKKNQDLYCKVMRQHLDSLNSKLGKNIYFQVPVGHAVIALRKKILKNEAPGLHTQEDLFVDNWGHPQEPVKLLAAYCFYASIYRISPVGLPVPANLTREWDPKLIRLLQELAWEAVTHHPLTGLSENQ